MHAGSRSAAAATSRLREPEPLVRRGDAARPALKFDPEMPGIEASVTDDTEFAKSGKYSVGVARQYSGTLGRTDNCQVAVSLHLADANGSSCIAMHLYLPEEEWVADKKRRPAVGVPEDVPFRRKWEIALEQLDAALAQARIAMSATQRGTTTVGFATTSRPPGRSPSP